MMTYAIGFNIKSRYQSLLTLNKLKCIKIVDINYYLHEIGLNVSRYQCEIGFNVSGYQ